MKILVTGATGYIGGTLAQRLVQERHQVHGLVRSLEKANLLAQTGIVPVLGTRSRHECSPAAPVVS